ncbi:hypothetical protein BP00DRAFT_154422 [Aspergillus indologenus CBS 114.80]|uniref:Uncharacterized protein n=1 Tax=Aspergillus indologenus CBS 114.80 TaxID=1450541 RepID=A0A2V5I8Z5_9EURO|nr:hypothetical protein BP00DRAFT_154422 [Aspergillus indologenus CBS 114.80]
MVHWLTYVSFSIGCLSALQVPRAIELCVLCIWDRADIDLQGLSMRDATIDRLTTFHTTRRMLGELYNQVCGKDLNWPHGRLDKNAMKELNNKLESMNPVSNSDDFGKAVPASFFDRLDENFNLVIRYNQLQLSKQHLISPKLVYEERKSGERRRQFPDDGTAAPRDVESLESNNNVKSVWRRFWDRLRFRVGEDKISKSLQSIDESLGKLMVKLEKRMQEWKEQSPPAATNPPDATPPSIRVNSESTPGLDGGLEMRVLG